jgi:hypothetical protein
MASLSSPYFGGNMAVLSETGWVVIYNITLEKLCNEGNTIQIHIYIYIHIYIIHISQLSLLPFSIQY